MSDKTGIEWTDSTWSPVRMRVRTDAAETARAKGYTSLVPNRGEDGRARGPALRACVGGLRALLCGEGQPSLPAWKWDGTAVRPANRGGDGVNDLDPMPPSPDCRRGCGLPRHRGRCKEPERFAPADGIRRCAYPECGKKLAASNPGPLCNGCKSVTAAARIARREYESANAEIREAERSSKRQRKELPTAAAIRTARIRIDKIPKTADSRINGVSGMLWRSLQETPAGEALVVPCDSRRHLVNVCELLRKRVKRVAGWRFVWKRDGFTLYCWREPEPQ